MLQCKNSKGDGPAIPPVVYRELVAAAAPTTSSYVVVLPVCARQWLAVEAPAAVRCAASVNAFRRVLSSCSACTYMYPGHFVPLAVGNAHVRIVGSWRYLAANLDVQYCSPTPGLLSRPAYRMRVPVQGNLPDHCAFCRACLPMSRVTPAAARIPRTGPQYPETSRRSHELHASSSFSDEPEPRDKTALSMLVLLPSLSRRGESTTVRWPCAGPALHIFPRCRASVA